MARLAAIYRTIQASAADPPPAADSPGTPPALGVTPGTAAGESQTPLSGSPAAAKPNPFQSQCNRCRVHHSRMGDLCARCVEDDRAINGLHGAYYDLRHLLGYADLLDRCPEGRVYLRLIIDACRGAREYAETRLEGAA